MTYEQLDFIADSYIPLLFIITVVFIIKGFFNSGIRQISGHIFAIVFSIAITYAVMLLDIKFKMWPAFEADYSTHTALALVFVTYFIFKGTIQKVVAIFSLFAYFILMMYQQYHSAIDIISTSLVVLPFFILLQLKGQKVKFS